MICVIDNDFYLTLPVIKGLAIYVTKMMRNSTDNYKLLFCHICPSTDGEYDDREENEKRFDFEMAKYNDMTNNIEASYFPLFIELGEPREYSRESDDIVASVKKAICEEKGWDEYQEDYERHIIFLLDLALEFRNSDPRGLEERRTWLATGVYNELKNKRVILYSSFSDEMQMWESFKGHYVATHPADTLDGIQPLSRAGLNPRTLDIKSGREILEWDGTI